MMGLLSFLTRTHKKFNAGGDVHPLHIFFKKAFLGKVLKIYIRTNLYILQNLL